MGKSGEERVDGHEVLGNAGRVHHQRWPGARPSVPGPPQPAGTPEDAGGAQAAAASAVTGGPGTHQIKIFSGESRQSTGGTVLGLGASAPLCTRRRPQRRAGVAPALPQPESSPGRNGVRRQHSAARPWPGRR